MIWGEGMYVWKVETSIFVYLPCTWPVDIGLYLPSFIYLLLYSWLPLLQSYFLLFVNSTQCTHFQVKFFVLTLFCLKPCSHKSLYNCILLNSCVFFLKDHRYSPGSRELQLSSTSKLYHILDHLSGVLKMVLFTTLCASPHLPPPFFAWVLRIEK